MNHEEELTPEQKQQAALAQQFSVAMPYLLNGECAMILAGIAQRFMKENLLTGDSDGRKPSEV